LVGEERVLNVLLPEGKAVKKATVNGEKVRFKQKGSLVTCKVEFEGEQFTKAQQIGEYDSGFEKRVVTGNFTIPKRIMTQLAERKKAWPVDCTEDDLVAPWMGPERLLLFVQVAEPYVEHEITHKRDGKEVKSMRKGPIRPEDVTIEIDGKPVEVRAGFNGVYDFVPRSCMGMYAVISDLTPDVKHSIKVTLPDGLAPGQFQGLFFEHVENEFTTAVSD
jgi:hypothetical protein